MRSFQQKQILDLIKSLFEATEEIRRLFLSAKYSDTLQLLTDCQKAAITIGEFIEGIEGEGTDTVKLLEEYHEILYNGAAAIETAGNSFPKKLKRQLIAIENSVKDEFYPLRTEMVFLPYKASMWDSLESIYLAAKDDPNCDAYVVPIPFYELNPDGSLGLMHYEGEGCYDNNIKITYWQDYDISLRKPDVIFTHYAYDDMGRNATIHPDFYSKTLKEHCNRLVYVPYFVLASEEIAEKDSYFAYLPGVLNSDQIIVQSENIRQSYIKYYKMFNDANNLNYAFGDPEGKFMALGSPKFDRVINSKESDYELPAEWGELIYDEYGMKKKVVFYNTHMFTWIDGGEDYFEKLKYVFEIIKAREDIVLWWRPHPNTELNFRTLRPDLLNKYFAVIENYKLEGWGIYDDTIDLHRAVAYCDVYYGDGSSVTELFKIKSKPIYFQHIDTTNEKTIELLEYFWLYITNLFEIDSELYATTFNDYIFKIEGESFKYDSMIPAGPNLLRHRNYFTQIVIDNKIMFIPFNSGQIAIYDIKTKEYNVYPLTLKGKYLTSINGENRNFFDGIIYKNKIFLVPCGYRNIVAFNLDTKETEHCLDLLALFPKDKMCSLTYGWTWLDENTILLASMYSNEILEFNLDTYEYKVHKVGDKHQSFHSIFKYGEYFFLVGRQPFILKWNYKTGDTTCYDNLPRGFKIEKEQDWVFYINNIKPYGNKLILPGGFTNMVLEFNFDSCEFRKLDGFDEILARKTKFEGNEVNYFITCNYMMDNFLYFIHKNEVLYRYDFETKKIDDICALVPTFTKNDYKMINNVFIDSMLKNEDFKLKSDDNDKLRDGLSGKRIYDYIKARW